VRIFTQGHEARCKPFLPFAPHAENKGFSAAFASVSASNRATPNLEDDANRVAEKIFRRERDPEFLPC
jgi:hypothetical protein